MEEELTKVTKTGARKGKKKNRILIPKKQKGEGKRESAPSKCCVNMSESRLQHVSAFRKKGSVW